MKIHRFFALSLAFMFGCATNMQSNMNEYFSSAKDAASKGNPQAASALGKAYYLGFMPMKMNNGVTYYIPVEKDHAQAYSYLKQAADENDLQAAALAAILVMNGDGTKRSEAEAIELFAKSASVNDESKYYLSQFYYRSADPEIRKRGFELVRDAESSDDPELVSTLAMYYENGVGVKVDKANAKRLKLKSASLAKERDELIKQRVAAFQDNAARKEQYSAAFGAERTKMITLLAVLSVVTVAAFVATASSNINLAGSANPPPPRFMSQSEMIAIGIIK